MISPDKLAAILEDMARKLRSTGDDTWQRTVDWERAARVERDSNRGGGGCASTEDIREHQENERLGRLRDKLDRATKQVADGCAAITAVMADTKRPPRHGASTDVLAAQAAADGWCRSCFRADQHLAPITLRPNGQPVYRDLCRFCGAWKGEYGQVPPLDVLRQHHDGRRIRHSA